MYLSKAGFGEYVDEPPAYRQFFSQRRQIFGMRIRDCGGLDELWVDDLGDLQSGRWVSIQKQNVYEGGPRAVVVLGWLTEIAADCPRGELCDDSGNNQFLRIFFASVGRVNQLRHCRRPAESTQTQTKSTSHSN